MRDCATDDIVCTCKFTESFRRSAGVPGIAPSLIASWRQPSHPAPLIDSEVIANPTELFLAQTTVRRRVLASTLLPPEGPARMQRGVLWISREFPSVTSERNIPTLDDAAAQGSGEVES